ncbi:uncharacterized protein LOC144657238 [Oculina patagonica]
MLLLPRHLRVVSFLAILCLTSCFWKECEGNNTELALEAFLLRTLHRNCNPDGIPSNDSKWEEIIRNLTQRFSIREYSCESRCGVQERNAPLQPKCYCDRLCEDFGDCCFDFDSLCKADVYPQTSPWTSNETCLIPDGVIHPLIFSYAVWNTCPQNWSNKTVRKKCQDEDENDLLRNLPVFDKDSGVHYRNIFCAGCNGAVNTTFWKFRFDCSHNKNGSVNVETFNLGNDKILLPSPKNCFIEKRPEAREVLDQLRKCIPKFQGCQYISPNSKKNGSYCQTECRRYAFPVCSQNIRFRNPQCALCNGFKLNELDRRCEMDDHGTVPSLTILFDFTSTSKYTVQVKDWKKFVFTITEKEFSCQTDEVFDPFAGYCKTIVSTARDGKSNETEKCQEIRQKVENGSVDGHLPSKHNNSKNWNENCTAIAFNKTDFVQLSNGSIYLKPHNKIYNNKTYMIRDSKLLLCVNFSRNFSRTEKEGGKHTITKTSALLQLLSAIGCIVSMVSLVLLLMSYILFAELRNLTGKIIINLALSLLLYQSVFFSAVKSDDHNACLAIAVLLHFFVLSSFTWMSVMAYDVRRIFTNVSEGVVAHRQNRHGGYTKRLIKYCLYAWGSPVLFVAACVITDYVKEGSIGYGQGDEECFISQPKAILYLFVLPVALLITFNLFALGHTVICIVKARKRTQQQKTRQNGPSVAVICFKMFSVMGVTWILGIAANLKALSFLWYPYVVLNSLQGLFIFLSFAASGKALELYKSKFAGILRNRTASAQSEEDNTRNHYCNHTVENEYSRDTQL